MLALRKTILNPLAKLNVRNLTPVFLHPVSLVEKVQTRVHQT